MSESEDCRIDHIKNTTLQLLNVSYTQWAALISKEENQETFKDFLESPTTEFLLLYVDQDENLLLSSEFPSFILFPAKIAYFSKKSSVISSENCKREINFGNLCDMPLNQYKRIFETVLCPIFSNPANNKRWPADIASDITLHFQDFQKILTYHVGVAQSKTVLVIPEMAKLLEFYDVSEMSGDQTDRRMRSVINAIADMVCDWIPIVKEVLNVISKNIQQGPASELLFWKNRKENLEFIQKQLSDPFIVKMLCALEKSDGKHYILLKNLLQDVAEALAEATEINESLSVMSHQLKKIEDCKFTEMKEDLAETLKIMTSSWNSSKYFCRVPSRISVLIQKFCFFLMQKVEDYLEPSELFKEKVLKTQKKVEVCIETLNTFLQSYAECQEHYEQDNKIYPWEFPDERIFNPFKSFLERLNKVHEIFEASVLYYSIPIYKILEISQAPFKMRLDKLSDSFKEYYLVFMESSYNPLDLECHEFLEDYNSFSTKVCELDRKLGIALFQACLNCITSEESFKFMKTVQNLLKRPLVNMEFKKQVILLRRNIYKEIIAAKESFDKSIDLFESDNQVIYKNLPSTSEKLQWSIDLQEKLSFPIYFLQHIQQYYNEDENGGLIHKSYKDVEESQQNHNEDYVAGLIHKTYKNMEESLQKFQAEIFSTWEPSLKLVEEQLNKPLFKECDQNLILNFAPQIVDLVQEIRYIETIQKTDLLPSEALALFDSVKSALLGQFLLASTLRWYDYLTQNLMDFEIMLIKEDWEKVSQDLKKGLDEKWTKSDLKEYSQNVYNIVKLLYEKVNQARKKINEAQNFIETWNKSPVFVRETPGGIVKFDMFMTPRMNQQIHNINESFVMMKRIMEENLQLFECDAESDEWRNYVLYLDSVIEIGLKESIQCSLQYLAENTNRFNKKLATFYKIRMILEKNIVFDPSLDRNELGSFYTLFEAIIERIYAPASNIKRLANPEMDYYEAVIKDNDLNNLKDQVFQHIESGINNILAHSDNYRLYSDIWLQDIDEVLEDFVLYGPLPDTKSEEEAEIQAEGSLEVKPPTEEEFKTEIIKFDMLQKKIEEIPNEISIESWLMLDTVSFKESLSSLIRSWSSAYKKKLVELKSEDKLRKEEYDRCVLFATNNF